MNLGWLVRQRDLALHRVMQGIPVDACSAIGGGLGTYLGQRRHRLENDRVMALLRHLSPALPGPVIDTQARDLWRNIGRTFAEFSVLPRIVREQRVRFGQEGLLRDLVTDPRPLIACFVHLGNWEAMGAALVLHPAVARHRKMTAVVALPQNPAHAMIAKRQHDWLSIQMLHAGPGIWRSALNALRQPNAVLWVAIDNSQGGDVGAPRLGVPRETNGNLSKIVRLAAATGAVVVPMYCERLQGAHFAAHILTPHEVPRGRLDETALRHEIDRLDLVFDPLVRQHVTQWYMAVEFSAVRADMTPKGSH